MLVIQAVILFCDGDMKSFCDLHDLRKQTQNLERPTSNFDPGTFFTTARSLSVSLTADFP